MGGLGRTLIILGVVLLVAGLLVTVVGRFTPLGRLPGDIVVRRSNFTFYFPIVTSIVLSVLLTLVMWFFQRR
jgi:fumarate reductase subunit D